MKISSLIKIIALIAVIGGVLYIAARQSQPSSDAVFLAGGAKGPQSNGEFAPPPNSPEPSVPVEMVQNITISTADWDKMTIRIKQCESEKRIEVEKKIAEIEAAQAKGKAECLSGLEKLVNERALASLNETVARAEEFKTELFKYRNEFAIINGDCVGRMSDGHQRMIRVKGDACLSVPFFKVGTGDGEIKGIEDAVSSEAMANGILSLSCDSGRAHIRPTNTPCGVAKGAITKTIFEKLN